MPLRLYPVQVSFKKHQRPPEGYISLPAALIFDQPVSYGGYGIATEVADLSVIAPTREFSGIGSISYTVYLNGNDVFRIRVPQTNFIYAVSLSESSNAQSGVISGCVPVQIPQGSEVMFDLLYPAGAAPNDTASVNICNYEQEPYFVRSFNFGIPTS